MNLIGVSPLLAPLGNYGSPTETIPPLPGSVAIDACTNSLSFDTDQRGVPRLLGGLTDIGAVNGTIASAIPFIFTGLEASRNAPLQLNFTNTPGITFTVLATTNVALSINLWTNLGAAVESPIGSGHFQFTDPQSTNYPHRFYRVRSFPGT